MSKKGLKTILVLRPQIFKTSRPRPQNMVLRPRPVLRTTSLVLDSVLRSGAKPPATGGKGLNFYFITCSDNS